MVVIKIQSVRKGAFLKSNLPSSTMAASVTIFLLKAKKKSTRKKNNLCFIDSPLKHQFLISNLLNGNFFQAGSFY